MTKEAGKPGDADGMVGALLAGRYEITRRLGAGGMATVYAANDRKTGRTVAVKAPLPHVISRPGFRERFDKEIRSLIELDHPHIVHVYDVGAHDGTPYLVMQYLSGGTLDDRLWKRRKHRSVDEVMRWLPNIVSALDHMHSNDLIHRDVKPANILFDETGHAFLSDFGISKTIGDTGTRLTHTGETPGTPAYMAPEQGTEDQIGGRADQYALGVIVFEALSGEVPHSGDSPLAVLTSKNLRPPRSLREAAPHLPQGVCDAVLRALAKKPEDRHPTCRAFETAFVEGSLGIARSGSFLRQIWVPIIAAFAVVAAALGLSMLLG